MSAGAAVSVWTDEAILEALDLIENEGNSAAVVAREMTAKLGKKITRAAVLGLAKRIRDEDGRVLDRCKRPENRDGGMGRHWWRREARA